MSELVQNIQVGVQQGSVLFDMSLVYLYTGEGEGKTTNAIGLAVRAVGHGYRAVIIQFLKGRKDIGEYKIKEKLSPLYEIYQFGREEFVNLINPDAECYRLAEEALKQAEKALEKKPRVLVLDEVNLAAAFGIVDRRKVLEIIDRAPEETVVVLTGRRAPREFIERADLVTEMRYVKHPYDRGIVAKKGVDF